ncbi:MAG: BlaI/MecI/CopY family transcriptional regulator [Eubacteriales bacterium]|nr:BlaI/MecI/CopY family transcriptional regulator [Eubacteriales bacterium]
MENKKKLGEAELEIMQVVWNAQPPVTSNYILKHLPATRRWALSTLMTSLSRLCDKGFLTCGRETGVNLYAPAVSEGDFKTREGKSFLERLYGNSLQNMVATLYSGRAIHDSDVAELRKFLDELEEENR